jgi:hypothetical protein
MSDFLKPIPLYTTHGDAAAFLVYPYLYNPLGEWIGWVAPDGKVFSVYGVFVGNMTQDRRIVRKREMHDSEPRRTPPCPPLQLRVPANLPLAPQMAELSLNLIDVLDEDPERLSPPDSGELRSDLD